MRGRKQNPLSRGEKIAARGASLSGAHEFGRGGPSVRGLHWNGVNLIAGHIAALVLKDQIPVISGEIRLSVLPTESKLPHIAEMFFSRKRKRRSALLGLRAGAWLITNWCSGSLAISDNRCRRQEQRTCETKFEHRCLLSSYFRPWRWN